MLFYIWKKKKKKGLGVLISNVINRYLSLLFVFSLPLLLPAGGLSSLVDKRLSDEKGYIQHCFVFFLVVLYELFEGGRVTWMEITAGQQQQLWKKRVQYQCLIIVSKSLRNNPSVVNTFSEFSLFLIRCCAPSFESIGLYIISNPICASPPYPDSEIRFFFHFP